MKKNTRTVIAGFLAFLLIVNLMFIFPTKKAEAIVWAIPAIPSAAEAGVGLATLIAGGVGALMVDNYRGDEWDKIGFEREVNNVAKTAYSMMDSMPTATKEDWLTAIREARFNGSQSVVMPQSVQDYLSTDLIPNLANNYKSSVPISSITFTALRERTDIWALENPLILNGVVYNYASLYGGTMTLRETMYGGDANIRASDYNMEHIGTKNGLVLSSITVTLDGDFTQDIPNPSVDVFAEQVGKNVDKVFDRAKRQGINMPWGLLAGLGVSGGGILYNPGDESWYNPDGSLYEGDFSEIDWAFPDLTVLTDSKGNVVYDVDGVPVLTVPGYVIPGVAEVPTTDVITGEPVDTANPTVPTKPNVPPSPKNIRWKDLLDAMSGFTRVFPFSIPWDIGNAYDAVFGGLTPTGMPEWTWEVKVLGKVHSFDVVIPSFFNNWFVFLRAVMLILFDVGIIYSIRKWFGGAS